MCWWTRTLLLIVILAALPPAPVAARPRTDDAPNAAARRGVLGYYVPYDPASWASLQEHPEGINAIGAQWVTIDACGNLASRDDQTLNQFARAHGIAVFPSLLTSSGWLNHQILGDPAVGSHAIEQIVEYVLAEGYDGFDLDLEGVEPADRPAYSAFVAALGAALHERGKALTLAIPAKASDVTTGWAGAYDYAALGPHADLITIMAYDYRGAWSGPGPVAPYEWVEQVLAFATSQMPSQKVLLGLAYYGYDWNTTSPWVPVRALGYGQAARLAQRHQVSIQLDPVTQSATFLYQAPAGDPPPAALPSPTLEHEITVREAPPCPVVGPTPIPRPTPRPPPPPEEMQEHEVWLEESASAAARLGLVERYRAGGVAAWRLGLEDPRIWEVLQQWRGGS